MKTMDTSLTKDPTTVLLIILKTISSFSGFFWGEGGLDWKTVEHEKNTGIN